jgi:hypothetical protein
MVLTDQGSPYILPAANTGAEVVLWLSERVKIYLKGCSHDVFYIVPFKHQLHPAAFTRVENVVGIAEKLSQLKVGLEDCSIVLVFVRDGLQ